MQKVDQQTQAQLSSFSTESQGYTLILPKNEFNDTAAGGAKKSVFSHFGINGTAMSSEDAIKVRTSVLRSRNQQKLSREKDVEGQVFWHGICNPLT